MNAILLFILFKFFLAGSQLPTSSSTILATFHKTVIAGDINALQSLIVTNSKYVKSPSAEWYRNRGLILAVQNRHASVVEILLKHGNVNAAVYNNEVIRLASANGDLDIVKLLLAAPEVDPGAMENEAIVKAAKNGHTEVVRLLLEHPNVKSSARNYLALFTAIRKNHADIVKLLISNERYIPTSVGLSIIKVAAQFENSDLVRYLLNHPSLKIVMHFIFYSDDLLPIKAVVQAGYIVDQQTLDVFLQHYRSNGNEDIVEYLETLKETPKLPERPLIAMTEQCAICLSDENLLEGFMTLCNHQFHVECLQKWITRHNSCPMCRSSII
jgi:hypothetical protein